MANLSVTFSDMQDVAKRISAGRTEIEAKLIELKNLVNGLVTAGYVTDTSSKAFEAAYTELNDGATKTIGGLEGISLYLAAAAESLTSTDEQLAKKLSR